MALITEVFLLPECALALVLLSDVSGSINPDEYVLQQQGFVQAFQSQEVKKAIEASPGGIAVSYIEWADFAKPRLEWRILKTSFDADMFASSINEGNRSLFSQGNTSLMAAMRTGVDYFDKAPCTPIKKVIDVSGDGPDNMSGKPEFVRDMAEEKEIIINVLPIKNPSESTNMVDYYNKFVKTYNGFLEQAVDFEDFPRAILKKISFEVM